MSTITTRSGKGSPLTNDEVDANFTNLNDDKLEAADLGDYAELTGATFTGEVEATGFNGDLTGAILFKASAGEALTKGDPVYISGISGNKTVVSKADANDSSKMPCFGIVDATVSLNADCSVVTFGTLEGLDTSSFSEGDELFVSNSGTLASTAPTGEASLLQKICKVTRSHASTGSIKVMGAGRTNATPNLNDGKFFLGNASNQAVSADFTTSVRGEISAGTGIGISNGVISNTAPDQTVSLTGSGSTSITGTYPSFTISSTDTNTTYSAGTGLSLTGTTFANTAPDQTVALTGSGATSISGTYPNFTISSTDTNTVYSLPLASSSTRGGVKIGYSENGKNYPVELSSEKMFVNVPWTDTNTTYSVGDGGLTEINFTSADHTKLNGIESGATADQTASEILTAIKTVDGSGSGLDADLLDGQQGSYYYPASNPNGYTSNVGDITGVTAGTGLSGGGTSGTVTLNLSSTMSPAVATELSSSVDLDTLNASQAGFYYQTANADTSGNNYPNGNAGSLIVQKSAGNATQLYQTYSTSPDLFFRSNYNAGYGAWRKVWNSGNDGSGSGLDADTVDGLQASSFVRSDATDIKTGTLNLRANLDMRDDSATATRYVHLPRGGGVTFYGDGSTTHSITSRNSSNSATDDLLISSYGAVYVALDRNNNDTGTANFVITKNGTTQELFKVDGETGAAYVNGSTVWNSGNDGSGSGLDADTVDGLHESTFMRRSANSQLDMNNNDIVGVDQIVHEGDTNTYMQFHAADQWRVVTGGVERLEVNNTAVVIPGTLNVRGAIDLADSDILRFGSADDVEFFFNGSHFYLDLNSGGNNFYIRDGTTTRFTFDDAGHFTATGNVTAYSDRRLKDDIQPIKGALEKVGTLSGNTYQRNDLLDKDPDRRYAGVIAQEVEVVLPEAVSESEDGTKTVDYNAVIALLVESVKELKAEVEQLKGNA